MAYAAPCPLIIDVPAISNCEISEDTLEIHNGSHGEISNATDMLVSGRDYSIFQWGYASLSTFTNSGSIRVDVAETAKVILNQGAITNLNNSGDLISTMGSYGNGYTIFNEDGNISNINNYGNIKSSTGSTGGGAGYGIYNATAFGGAGGTIGLINNTSSGIITTTTGFVAGPHFYGIANAGGDIGTITNRGQILPTAYKSIYDDGTISIDDFAGIYNIVGTIHTVNNLQGGLSPLTYRGELPSSYGIIINNATDYGKILFGTISGSTNFNIHTTSALDASHTYAEVLNGIDATQITGTSGTFISGSKSYDWLLINRDGTLIWDLNVGLCTGCSESSNFSSDTQSSLKTLASRLRGSYNSASLISNFPNSNTYDCNLFDVKGMCISAGGRYSTVDNPSSNSTAAVVTLGYKVSPSIRIGGFLDQSVTNNNPTGINISNKNPMMGVFAYWNQNADGLGYQVKVANAYQDKDLSTTRAEIGTSEAGRGTTSLNSRSYVGELSYAFMYKENTLVRPYFALRHTTIEQDAYTETGVANPLTYSALNNRTTSALMGVKFKHALTPKANLIGSLGVEQDLHHKTDQLTATSASIAGLTSENFSGNIHRTRPVASIGATYDIAKSQRLSGEVLVQQLPFQSTAGATAYFNYMIGF